ncbi:MAG: hypothetical protein J5I47_05645 [Vicingus serpentipes]|nr:hypothetical protein [Vicingus serpentipes]
MEKAEKRYFKIYASKYNGSRYYVDLFEAIEKQTKKEKSYNEQHIISHFKTQNFVKNFSVTKAYLYKKILRSMREFYADSITKEEEIKEIIDNIRYLIKRSLFTQAKKLLIKAHQIADDYERFVDKLELINMERLFISYINLKESKEVSYKRLYELELYSIDCIKKISEQENISNEIYLKVLSLGEGDRAKFYDELEVLNNHPLLKNEDSLTLYRTKRSYYHAKAMYHRAIEEYDRSFLYQKKRFELFDEYPMFVHLGLSTSYISALNNLLLSCIGMGNQKYFDYYISLLRSFKSKEKKIQCAVFTCSYNMEINMCLKYKNFEEILAIIPIIENGLKKYRGIMESVGEQNILFGVACLYFRLKEHRKAIEWINKLFDYEESLQHHSIQSSIKIMQLFIYYELNYTESLPHLLRSTQRYFLKKGKMFEIEKQAISTVKLLMKDDKEKKEEIYSSFKKFVDNSEELLLTELLGRMGLSL